jgi:hypothetical protein
MGYVFCADGIWGPPTGVGGLIAIEAAGLHACMNFWYGQRLYSLKGKGQVLFNSDELFR